jgi:hypothetical protein
MSNGDGNHHSQGQQPKRYRLARPQSTMMRNVRDAPDERGPLRETALACAKPNRELKQLG